jgi:hypothetical protein
MGRQIARWQLQSVTHVAQMPHGDFDADSLVAGKLDDQVGRSGQAGGDILGEVLGRDKSLGDGLIGGVLDLAPAEETRDQQRFGIIATPGVRRLTPRWAFRAGGCSPRRWSQSRGQSPC